MKSEIIYKLNIISLILYQINIPFKEENNLEQGHYCLQLLLNDLLIQESDKINVVRRSDHLKLELVDTFRMFDQEIFSRQKVVRLKFRLIRMKQNDEKWIQQFNIILSQYSYLYCKEKFNTFRQHSVGAINSCFLHFKIYCEYEQQLAEAQIDDNRSKQKEITSLQVKNDEFLGDNSKFSEEYLPSDVFIQLNQLKPVTKYSITGEEVMKIKLQKSIIKIENSSEQNSTIQQKIIITSAKNKAFPYVFYIYMAFCLIILIIQMFPSKKV